ncbi:MAG: hypothetical protein AB1453_03435 [Chloroflexota bacterium]|jgi:hypothetical protein
MAKKSAPSAEIKPQQGERQAATGKGDPAPLPFFIEVVFCLSGMLLILVTLLIAVVSFLSGASLVDIFLRGLVGVITLGSVLWLLSYLVSSSLLTGQNPRQGSDTRAPGSYSPAAGSISAREAEQEG